jgi:hypothetical protein
MTRGQPSYDEQPQFSWISEWSRSARLALKRKDRPAPGQSLQMFVFRWGFRWISGDDTVSARWEDVADFVYSAVTMVKNGRRTETGYYYKLTLTNGWSARLPGHLRVEAARESQAVSLVAVPGVTTPVTIEQLGRLMMAEITRIQLPRATAAYNAGQPVTFGPVTVSQHGIAVGNKSLPWNEIQEVETSSGSVSVKKVGQRLLAWKVLPVNRIPNYFVFDALVRTILAGRVAAGPPTGGVR